MPIKPAISAALLLTIPAYAQQPLPQAPIPQAVAQAAAPTVSLDIPHSHNPLDTYRAVHVPLANLSNSPRLDTLIHAGVLELSLKDAIALALENNLDLAIARYNIPIAKADVLRTQAGGVFLGVNTGVVQNTPGGGVGGFGSASSGAGAGGTSGGAGGAGGGAGGLVQSTLGSGSLVSSYDPLITGTLGYQNSTTPLSSQAIYGVPTLQQGAFSGTLDYTQAFPTGTSIAIGYNADRLTSNSPFTSLTPELDSSFQAELRQHLLSGFGLGPNLRYLHIARNNQRISDRAFELQVATTVTQIANIYWDLVAAYEDEQVKQRSLDFANQTLATGRKQLDLQAIPALDVTKDEAEVATREDDLTIAKSQLQFQSLLIKNALTKNLDDPILEAIPVVPTDLSTIDTNPANTITGDLVAHALATRIELVESGIDLQNRKISRDAVRNELLPTVDLVGYYGAPASAAQTTRSRPRLPLHPAAMAALSSIPSTTPLPTILSASTSISPCATASPSPTRSVPSLNPARPKSASRSSANRSASKSATPSTPSTKARPASPPPPKAATSSPKPSTSPKRNKPSAPAPPSRPSPPAANCPPPSPPWSPPAPPTRRPASSSTAPPAKPSPATASPSTPPAPAPNPPPERCDALALALSIATKNIVMLSEETYGFSYVSQSKDLLFA